MSPPRWPSPAARPARGGPEIFDDDALQARLAAFYRDIDRHFPRDRVAHVNGDAGADAVHRAVLAEVEAILARA